MSLYSNILYSIGELVNYRMRFSEGTVERIWKKRGRLRLARGRKSRVV